MTRCPLPGCGASLPCAHHRMLQARKTTQADRARAKRSDDIGKAVQLLMANRLRVLGVLQVEPIQTGFRRMSKVPMPRVQGDFRGILPGGRSVLIEVKHRRGRLSHADFAPHQLDALRDHSAAGGLALVGWSWGTGFAFLEWPAGMAKGQGIGTDEAIGSAWRGVVRDRAPGIPVRVDPMPVGPKLMGRVL